MMGGGGGVLCGGWTDSGTNRMKQEAQTGSTLLSAVDEGVGALAGNVGSGLLRIT